MSAPDQSRAAYLRPPIPQLFRSVAVWPAGTIAGNSANESDDTHSTHAQAQAVCDMLCRHGFGGDGRVFPVSVRVEELRADGTAKTPHFIVEDDRLGDDWPVFETRATAVAWIERQVALIEFADDCATPDRAALIQSAIAGIVERLL